MKRFKWNRHITVSPARRTAFEILSRVDFEQSYASNLLASKSLDLLSAEDRRLCYELVLGLLRHQNKIDYLLTSLSGKKVERLDKEVVIALRLGLYQLNYLSRLPERAVVNESVNIVKATGKSSASGFVNAVLRKALQIDSKQLIAKVADPLQRASFEYCHPEWLLKKWSEKIGLQAACQLAEANNNNPQTTFRINSLISEASCVVDQLETKGLKLGSDFIEINPNVYKLLSSSSSILTELMLTGAIYIQDEASMFVASLLQAEPGDTVLDLCSAPGSKTTMIAEQMQNTGKIIAGDIHYFRLKVVDESCTRMGIKIVDTVALDALKPPFHQSVRFDKILVDTPCTGTGTLRRNPEIKWRLSSQKIAEMAELQKKILSSIAPYLKPGGRMVYSTCSVETEENEEVVADFLSENQNFSIQPATKFRTEDGFMRSWPHTDGIDGFFAAIFVKIC
ncbi:MAG: 16S rRNA (cytosine(967)-C(5))-methyltransferase RsmB [Blastocatellia bacterium]|nr:16S rRNA (cytosine(967)-C(5))-methyltransferase RsmB [Blastocatellia bacterium]